MSRFFSDKRFKKKDRKYIAFHKHNVNLTGGSYFAFRIAFGLAEEDEILEEEHVPKTLLPSLPAIELALADETALLFDVDVTVPQRIHG